MVPVIVDFICNLLCQYCVPYIKSYSYFDCRYVVELNIHVITWCSMILLCYCVQITSFGLSQFSNINNFIRECSYCFNSFLRQVLVPWFFISLSAYHAGPTMWKRYIYWNPWSRIATAISDLLNFSASYSGLEYKLELVLCKIYILCRSKCKISLPITDALCDTNWQQCVYVWCLCSLQDLD